MRILALETSTEYCSVALWLDGEVHDRRELAGQRHSMMLIPMLDGLLSEAGLKLANIDGIAFGAGPGSFTGVRIACSAAQGLALGADKQVAGICTLEALAEDSGRGQVIAALDARMDEVYFAAYTRQADAWQAVCEPCLCLPDHAPHLEDGSWFGVGSGFLAHGALLRSHYGDRLADVNEQAVPQAAAIARLAARRFAAGQGVDAAEAMPLYLRDRVALKTSERG